MAQAFRSASVRRVSRLLSVLAILSASVAATYLLLPNPLADAFFAAWVLVSVILALIGGSAAWTHRTPLVWAAALLLTGLSVVGMWSIGPFIAPAALFLLGSAVLLQWAGPRKEIQEAIIADPPPVQDAALKAVVGIGSVVVGSWLVYAGAFARELFEACARETLACAIGKTHWDALGIAVLGLIAVGLGGGLLWKQVYIARVLASKSGPT